MNCTNKHRYHSLFQLLPDHQGGIGRHKCAGCAYEMGYKLGLERVCDIKLDLEALPDSQAGTIRHKCPHTAFVWGYEAGLRDSLNQRVPVGYTARSKVTTDYSLISL